MLSRVSCFASSHFVACNARLRNAAVPFKAKIGLTHDYFVKNNYSPASEDHSL
jgi:hypothetical protein